MQVAEAQRDFLLVILSSKLSVRSCDGISLDTTELFKASLQAPALAVTLLLERGVPCCVEALRSAPEEYMLARHWGKMRHFIVMRQAILSYYQPRQQSDSDLDQPEPRANVAAIVFYNLRFSMHMTSFL